MRKTIQTLLITLFITLTTGCKTKNKANPILVTEDDKKALRYLKEHEWPKAYAEQDTLLLDRILGDDFKMIDNLGNWYSKKDELAWLKKNAIQNDSFNYEIKRFEILDNGTAIICGTGHILKDSIKSIYQIKQCTCKKRRKMEGCPIPCFRI